MKRPGFRGDSSWRCLSARRTLAKHVQKLGLTPQDTPEGHRFDVSGHVDLFGGDPLVVQIVTRDGFAQHTRRFEYRCWVLSSIPESI